jgi:RNA polymerase sigma factor (sigma-70 family)
MTKADFNNLVHQLNRTLYGYAFRILRNQEEAEDAVQEIFIKLWNMGTRLKEYNSLGALATTMTKNYCIDQIRKKKHIIQDINDGRDIRISDNSSPYVLMENKESDDIIHQIIGQLPEIYRDVIKLKDIDGLSYEEIAHKTEQNINTLRVTLSRARKMIRDEFNKYQYERRGTEEVNRKVL